MINGTFTAYGTAGTGVTLGAKDVAGTTKTATSVPRSAYVSSEVAGIATNTMDPHFSAAEYDVVANSYKTTYDTLGVTFSAASSAVSISSATVTLTASKISAAWTLSGAAAVTVSCYSNTTNSNSGGTLVTTQSVASGTVTCDSSATPVGSRFYYAVIKITGAAASATATTTTVSSSTVISGVLVSTPTISAINVSVVSGSLVVSWTPSASTGVTLTVYASTTNANSGGTPFNSIGAIPGVTSINWPDAPTAMTYYYAIVTPMGGADAVSSAYFYSGIPNPILKMAFSTTAPKIVDLSPSSRTFNEYNTPTYTANGRGSRTTFTATTAGGAGQFVSISGAFPAGSFTKAAWVKYSGLQLYGHILSGSGDGIGGSPLHLHKSESRIDRH